MVDTKAHETEELPESGFFEAERNCWQVAKAEKAALLIDCANYYRALYHALCKAKHSIFILGWDIDGRIELLRGEEAKGKDIPVDLFNLIRWKAKNNPDLKIYLNKWNYSILFTREREPFSGLKWYLRTPQNVHFCSDYKIPFTGSHHQKIIVVDDEIAFCGGMDIALGRWDKRQHYVDVKERVDPGFVHGSVNKKPYGPYHDIQIMLCGPVVKALAELVRERWYKGAGYDSVPMREDAGEQCEIWPDFKKPGFVNVEVGVARTLPRTKDQDTVKEVLRAFLDEIAQAEKFIYIENQFLTTPPVAEAINKRLKEKPDLRVLVVSSDHPHGIMEHKAMWSGRVNFCKIANEGIEDGRFAVTYPVSREQGQQKTIHIHSKLMVIDDRFLHVGSANLNNRSMGFDTECDIIIYGQDEKTCARIAAIRNNLIREHTGREEKDIDTIINQGRPLCQLLAYQTKSRQHLLKIDNKPYENIAFAGWARKIGDPMEAHFLVNFPARQILSLCFVAALVAALFWLWLEPAFAEFFTKETIIGAIEQARESRWSVLWVTGIYVLAGLVFFPITVLNLTTAIVFGPVFGFLFSLFGSVSSATLTFVIGHFIGEKTFAMFRNVMEKIKTYASHGGVIGMTLIRLMPIAPFTLINLAFGIVRVPFLSYILATVFGLLPGITAKAVFGGAVGELWQDPDPQVIFFIIGSLLLWFLIIWASHRVVRHYKTEMDL